MKIRSLKAGHWRELEHSRQQLGMRKDACAVVRAVFSVFCACLGDAGLRRRPPSGSATSAI